MASWVVWHWVKGDEGKMRVAVVGEVDAPDKQHAERRALVQHGGGYKVQSRVSFDLTQQEVAAIQRHPQQRWFR